MHLFGIGLPFPAHYDCEWEFAKDSVPGIVINEIIGDRQVSAYPLIVPRISYYQE